MIRVNLSSDYMEGAHSAILSRLCETNTQKSAGYGLDEYSEDAKEKIRTAAQCPTAQIFFLSGGTQANLVTLDALLKSYEGVIAAQSGHISLHEAGAIEHGGHKVLTIPHKNGKISAQDISRLINGYNSDENRDHMVKPGGVYISQPTEYGTIYSKEELSRISAVCREAGIFLYCDGARLAYALGCSENDVFLPDLAKYCDAFYIGGTKCGALFGEAVVFPDKDAFPHFFTIIKQHGALCAKGRILGIQFGVLFENGLYTEIGKNATALARRAQKEISALGYETFVNSPTNQQFFILTKEQYAALREKAAVSFWENLPDGRIVIRIAASFATTKEDIDEFISVMKEIR